MTPTVRPMADEMDQSTRACSGNRRTGHASHFNQWEQQKVTDGERLVNVMISRKLRTGVLEKLACLSFIVGELLRRAS
jgi:hypothetical protein